MSRCGFAALVLIPLVGYAQLAELRNATPLSMAARADCNSPAFWRDGELRVLTSTGDPMLGRGFDQFSLGSAQAIGVTPRDHWPIWFESVWQDEDGTLYAWYHHEPGGVCGGSKLTAPKIGAAVSFDGGETFTDLGIVLDSGDPVDCSAKNGFFAGGHGDFSVILDNTHTYFYFLYDNYGGDVSGQGVAMARMAFADRTQPAGAVWKYYNGEWKEPGVGGRVSPSFPTRVAWQQSNTDSFWGASVHWNTYLETYVVLMNHACCKTNWPQEGIYITFNPDLSNPAGWSEPVKILGKVSYDAGYYPQVIGMGPGETDTVAGQVSRLWVHGRSLWEIVFWKWEDLPEPTPVDPGGDPEPPTDLGPASGSRRSGLQAVSIQHSAFSHQ